ncbi:MAG: restriction endonuclease subunit S, partial [Bacilli bacterium]|nr:restriction endonuclease subunit S [Bacilli bacterium]
MSKLSNLGEVLNGKEIPKETGLFPAYGGNGIISYVNNWNYPENTIVIGRVGANCGAVYFSTSKCWVTDNALAFIVNDKNNPYFVYYLLKYLDLNRFHIGSSQPLITQSIINSIDLTYITDKQKQNKIAKILHLIDQKIVNNNKINFELESMAKTLYDYWFLQFEFPNEEGKPYKSSGGKMVWNEELKREIPEGWELKHAYEIADIKTGKEDANHSTENGKYPFFTCSNDILRCDDYKFEGNVILIAGNGDFNVKHYNGKFNAYQRTYVIKPYDEKYIGLFHICCNQTVEQFKKGSNGSIVKFITLSDIQNVKMLDCKNDNLLTTFNKSLEQIDCLKKENEELLSLRDFLLPLLMNGQVTFKEES